MLFMPLQMDTSHLIKNIPIMRTTLSKFKEYDLIVMSIDLKVKITKKSVIKTINITIIPEAINL